jgi:hypothetical protein
MATRWMLLTVALATGGIAACGSSDDDVVDGRDDGAEGECAAGEGRCVSGMVWETCTGGHWGGGVDCGESADVCVDGLGCVDCYPDHTRCTGNDVETCGEDGTTWTVTDTCDTAAGETCDTASGVCIDPCGTAAVGRSNIGCEYWAVDLDNAENATDFAAFAQFAVVVANLSNLYSAEVVIDKDEAFVGEPHSFVEVDRATVDPGQLHVFNLRRWDVDGDNAEHRDDDPQTTLSRRVYHIVSTTPVVAYAFQPIEQAYSNGAYVLIPTTALDTDYYAVIWPPANPFDIPGLTITINRDYVTIVGVEDGTTVTVTPTYDIFAGVGQPASGMLPVDGIVAGTPTEFTLDRFDVLNLESEAMHRMTDPIPDLTGTHVSSTRPVVVYTGVDLAGVGDKTLPDGTSESCCAEFMGAQLTPTSALGQNFVVSRSPSRSSNPTAWLEYEYYRVFAVRDGTSVTTTLTEPGLDAFTLNAGEWREFSAREGFILQSAPTPVIVAQYLTARDQVYNWRASAGGDPDMVYIPPVEQRRETYVFGTGVGFSETWAVISMPDGTTATIDGADVATTCTTVYTDGEYGGLTYRAYHCPITEDRHEVQSLGPEPVGVMVFGYYNAGSYQYPAGSEFNQIFFG